jgi:hypothetical protein
MIVVMLTILGVFLYSEKQGKVAPELASHNGPAVGNGGEEIKYAKLRTVDEISSRMIPQTTLPEPSPPEPIAKNNPDKKSPTAADSKIPDADQHIAAAPLGTKQAVDAAENNSPARKIAIGPILTDDKQSENIRPRGDNGEKAPGTGDFDVVAASFVRGKPTSNADIIATLKPGSHVNVSGRTGDYYQVRTLGNETIHGYVHREDAFFEKRK